MSLPDELDPLRAHLETKGSAVDASDNDPTQSLRNLPQRGPVATTAKVNLIRRRLIMGSAVVGIGGVAAAMHDGELGGPPQTFRGAIPWQEGAADAPPEASGSGYIFFAPAEAAFVDAAVARLIPHDPVGPGAVEAGEDLVRPLARILSSRAQPPATYKTCSRWAVTSARPRRPSISPPT